VKVIGVEFKKNVRKPTTAFQTGDSHSPTYNPLSLIPFRHYWMYGIIVCG
jgi:hypothetical protein